MKPADIRPAVLRFIAAGLAAFLLLMSLMSFYQFAGSATDENLFTNPPSKYLVKRAIPAFTAEGKSGTLRTDSIPAGVYLFTGRSENDIHATLRSIPADSLVDIYGFFPAKQPVVKMFRVPARRLTESANFVLTPKHVVVIDITPGGASDRAGMLVGDQIVAINGESFDNMLEADRLMRLGGTGRAIDYDIVRGDQHLRLHVTLASFGFPLPALIASLSGLITFAIGAFILMKKPNIVAARLIGLEFLLVGFVISVFMVRRDADPTPFVVLRTTVLAMAYLFLAPLARHGATYFPRDLPALRAPRWSLRLPYIVAGVTLLLLPLTMYFPMPLGGFDLYLFGAGLLPLIVTGVVAILTRKGKTAEYKRMRRAVRIVGIITSIVAVVAILFLALTGRGGLMGFVGILVIPIPVAYLYTIGRYRLLDMDVRVRRNVQWGFFSTVWSAGTLALLFVALLLIISNEFWIPSIRMTGLAVEVTGAPSTGTDALGPARWILAFLAIGVFLVVRSVRSAGQSFINRRFFRQPTDYTHAVSALSEVLTRRLSMVALGKGMVEKLGQVLRLKSAAVFFFRESGACCCQEVYGVAPGVWSDACALVDRQFVDEVGKLSGASRPDYLSPYLRTWAVNNGFQFIIPIRSQDKLIGTLLLGEKQSEGSYSAGEMEFMNAAAQQASVAIENAFLYEELAEKERMEAELKIARQIQVASLPQRTPSLPAFEVAGASIPAMEVGGDFFDYLTNGDGRLTVVVGDVSGKGTSAALYMSKVQGILRSLHEFHLTPGQMFVRANRLLAADMVKSSFVTAIGAAFQGKEQFVTLARAGHLPLYILRSGQSIVERLTPKGLGLALDENAKFQASLEEVRLPAGSGDIFLFVTDGVTEAHNVSGEEFGEDRVLAFLKSAATQTSLEIRDGLLSAVTHFAGDREPDDDRTVVVVRITGKSSSLP